MMKDATLIIDEATGALTIEGLGENELCEIVGDLLPSPAHVNCARPVGVPPIITPHIAVQADAPSLRVYRIYHGSVVEGPGRRSVIQLQGCDRMCEGCFVTETHSLAGGVRMSVHEVIELVLASEGEPRDRVTILGGEPFMQPDGLAVLVRKLKARGLHITLYSGYTLAELRARTEPGVHTTLALADILIDGPFVASQARAAGEWRGSRNQQIINLQALRPRRKCTEAIKS